MAEKRVESEQVLFDDKVYTTVTTIEENSTEPKKTEIWLHDDDEYDKIAADEDADKDLIATSEKHGKKVLLGTVEGGIPPGTTDITFKSTSTNDFEKEINKNGTTSLTANLNGASIDAIVDETGEDIVTVREGYTEYTNTSLEQTVSSINFSSEDIPLTIQTSGRRTEYETLFYPEDIASTTQDRIKFSMKYISGNRDINFNFGNLNPLSVGNRTTTTITGSATLPITGGIQDKNSVKFDSDSMNMFQALGAGAVLNPQGAAETAVSAFNNFVNMDAAELQRVITSPAVGNIVAALRLSLAQTVSGGNLLSRVGGGILNPNMELLFQAPTLRTFNFSFVMSARSSTEATQIKKIIRFFKQGMSVKKTDDNIFVVSPNIFNIKYLLGDSGQDHPSIGRIKDCALLDLNTTYGNGNTYMTYSDPDRTMTQYKIDMTFQELDPITENDYLSNTGPLADPDEAFRVDPNNNAFPGEIGY